MKHTFVIFAVFLGLFFASQSQHAFAAVDFALTTPTTAIGAGTPTRAISITLTGSGILASDAIFTLSDGGAGGTFYLRATGTGSALAAGTTTKILSGQTVGAVEQFAYVAPVGATGTITLTATASGGLVTGPHSLALPIGTATRFVNDQFAGTNGTNLIAHTPNIGATWIRSWQGQGTPFDLFLNGSGGASAVSGDNGLVGQYMVPTATPREHDVVATFSNIDSSKIFPELDTFGLLTDAGHLTTYEMVYNSASGWSTNVFLSNTPTTLFSTSSPSHITGSTMTPRIAVRLVNGLQYLFFFDGGTLINGGPVQDGKLTSGDVNLVTQTTGGAAPGPTVNVVSNFHGDNVDWAAASPGSINISPTAIPKSHSGNITLSLVGAGTSWVSSTTIFTPSGVPGVAKISQNVTSSSAATIVVTTGANTGTLIITESGTGNSSGTTAINTATISPSPSTGSVNTTSTITITGANTLWTKESWAGLFSVSGGTGALIGTPTCATDTSCVATLTAGSTSGTLTITETSTGATTNFTVGGSPVIATFPNANILLSPYVWRTFSGSIDAPTGGAYLKGVVSGTTSILANVDTSGNSGQSSIGMPSFKVTIDDGVPVYVQEATGATQVTLASGMTTGSHRYLVQVIGANTGVGNCWTGLACHTIINSLQFDTGSVLSAPAVRPKTCLVQGDSYLMSVVAASQGSNPWYQAVDYTQSWPQWIAGGTQSPAGLNCEIGQQGMGGTGWDQPGDAVTGFPAFTGWWNKYDSTHARDMTVIPDYYIEAIGVNDHVGTWNTSQINTAIITWHTALRATAGWANVKTFVVLPFGDASDAVNHAQIAATTASFNDPNLHVINIGPEWPCLPFSGGASSCSFDGLHPSIPYHGVIASDIMQGIQTVLDGTGGTRGYAFTQ